MFSVGFVRRRRVYAALCDVDDDDVDDEGDGGDESLVLESSIVVRGTLYFCDDDPAATYIATSCNDSVRFFPNRSDCFFSLSSFFARSSAANNSPNLCKSALAISVDNSNISIMT